MYRVIEMFIDLQDGDYTYHEGDKFPRDGVKASKERIDELKSKKNLRGVPLIKYERDKKDK